MQFQLYAGEESTLITEIALNCKQNQQVRIGKQAFVNLVSINFPDALPLDTLLAYNFVLMADEQQHSLVECMPEILYPEQKYPNFSIKSDIKQMLHGSCRKPHFDSGDGLVQVDHVIAESVNDVTARPAMLMMSGDQIYADDVAGPMLVAIHQVIELLGLYDEQWQGTIVNSSEELFSSPFCYYQRDQLLPHDSANKAVYDKIFAASKKPIFTSVNSKNHLVTLAEVFAMYLLTWSPIMWRFVDLKADKVAAEYLATFQTEVKIIERFINGLQPVSRALAHIPSYMIFDDHDITDDWNLTRGWEEAAYGHPFSKRIIGNTLIGYWLCQGWGNAPEKFTDLNNDVEQYFTTDGYQRQDELIDKILVWDQWHYSLATTPKIIVLDTRTQRWRSESNAGKPSGLMDWEALSELQQELINQPEVILVSPAPIYGVKVIETIQRIFTFFGFPLVVDAENWMAHSGTANVMLNIFRHYKTPPHFIILSGDVHYSFFYEVTHRFRRNSSRIFQITASGIKNQFPSGLLRLLERLNRYLYASYSPLNWFTKRRRMKVKVRKPDPEQRNTLVNQSGIGLITLTADEQVVKAELLTANNEKVLFHPLKINEQDK
ncbi:metallophosphoesterase family protein [Cognaticolwellia mytili]|uniref:alkaline phosphatase family protein n=1 Tax=Cognaticolwellia mytili TaxID=1888913 RepID=UPI001F276145|nr:alkaline phosphatase family protein [Cognaticolwellia mytili]